MQQKQKSSSSSTTTNIRSNKNKQTKQTKPNKAKNHYNHQHQHRQHVSIQKQSPSRRNHIINKVNKINRNHDQNGKVYKTNKIIKSLNTNGYINNNNHRDDKDKDKAGINDNEISLTPSPSPQSFINNNSYYNYNKYKNTNSKYDYNKYINNINDNNTNNILSLSIIYGYIRLYLMKKEKQPHNNNTTAYNANDNDNDNDNQYMDDDFDSDNDNDNERNGYNKDYGYIAPIPPLKFIRNLISSICQLILLYFDDNKFNNKNIQNGQFVWRLPTLTLLTCKSIRSLPFQIGSFLWYLSIYPYGCDSEHINFTNLYINLSSAKELFNNADFYRSIIINARLYCVETKSCWSSIKIYNSVNSYHGWQKGALKISECCSYNYLTFIVYINVLRVIEYRNNLILYQYPLSSNSGSIRSKFIIKWKISSLLITDLRSANCMKRFESDILYNQWVLGCVPHGIKKDSESSVFKIYLKLCALPPSISRIKCKFNILCVETKKHLKYIYNDFDYKHKYWQTDKLCKRSYLMFNDFNILRFKTEIEIIELYDLNNNELSSIEWQQSINNNNTDLLVTPYVSSLQLNVLVSGYIRRYNGNHNHNYISSQILQYYPSSCGSLFSWRISCEQIIKLSQLNFKQRFDSKIFNISSLKWFLQIYPNGYRAEDEGFCSVYLILAYLPVILREITIHFGVYCPQTMSNFSTIHTFNHSRDGRGTRRMLSLKHLKKIFNNKCDDKFIIFNCYVNILNIKSTEKNKTDNIIYQYPLKYNKSLLRECRAEWNINNKMMKKFKECKNGQRFESEIFNEMWNLSCFPNENKKEKDISAVKNEQNVVIGIRLCALPKNISKIYCKYNISCKQFINDNDIRNNNNNDDNYKWSHSAYFDYDNYYVKNPKHTIKSKYIQKYKKLTFNVTIIIKKLYDLNGNEI